MLACWAAARAQEVHVNEAPWSDQELGEIASGPGGTFWAVWLSRFGVSCNGPVVVMRRLDAGGGFLTGDMEAHASCPDPGPVDVAILSSGRMAVVYGASSGGQARLHARLFDPDGTPLGGDFAVDELPASTPVSPSLVALRSDRFAIAWHASGWMLHGRIMLPDGSLLPEQLLDSDPGRYVALAPSAPGGVMAVWTREDSSEASIRGRLFDETFTPVGPVGDVSEPALHSFEADLDPTPQGFLASYTRRNDDYGDLWDVVVRRLDANGSPAQPELVLSAPAWQRFPQAVVNGSGLALVSWVGPYYEYSDTEIEGQLLDTLTLTRIGPRFEVSGRDLVYEYSDDVAVLGDHRFVVLWNAIDGDADGRGELMRRYAFPLSLAVAPGPDPGAPASVELRRPHGVAGAVTIPAYQTPGYGTNPGAGDIDGAPLDEALSGPGPSPVYGPHVRAFRAGGTPIAKVSYYAYGTLRYGVRPAGARLDADAPAEILTAPGEGDVFGPHIRGWNFDGGPLAPIARVNFFAYQTLKYGARVAAGDIDADGFQEILTGPGPGPSFAPLVRGFDYDGTAVQALAKVSFWAFGAATTRGVTVAAADVESDGAGGYGDGYAEIVAGVGADPWSRADVELYDYDGTAVALKYSVTTSGSSYGTEVAGGDVDAGDAEEVVTSPGPNPAEPARVVVWEWDPVTSGADDDGPNLRRIGPDDFVAFQATAYGAKAVVGSFE